MPLYIGLMSGTSMDSVDAALVAIDVGATRLECFIEQAIPNNIQTALKAVTSASRIEEIARLDTELGDLFALAANNLLQAAAVDASSIRAIGSHGQTVLHKPIRGILSSLQIADPNRITQQTGITTVADFRRMDIAHQGQGAPLAPAFHHHLFHDAAPKVIVNIGGFANLTLLPGEPDDTVTGFDSGPGNVLMDAWIERHCQQAFDKDGAWAETGRVQEPLLRSLLNDPYFQQPPPKSTGRDYFHLSWLEQKLDQSYAPEDIQATLLALTVESIAIAAESQAHSTTTMYVCGGGAYNLALMGGLKQRLGEWDVADTSAIGLAPNAVEAACFAWLAHQRLEGQPSRLARVTGADSDCILGAVYAAQSDRK